MAKLGPLSSLITPSNHEVVIDDAAGTFITTDNLVANLPSYVDDVLEYADAASFPGTGETGKIYIAQDTNDTYRWTGSVYVKISDVLSGSEIKALYEAESDTNAFTDADHSKLDGIESNATADQTDAEILAAVESESGRDMSVDGTKLDGIEASADVTDTANVTAAGALMDSEVTNLAQVKAFDSGDYATAAQGSTADTATQPGDNVSTLTNDSGFLTGAAFVDGAGTDVATAAATDYDTVTLSGMSNSDYNGVYTRVNWGYVSGGSYSLDTSDQGIYSQAVGDGDFRVIYSNDSSGFFVNVFTTDPATWTNGSVTTNGTSETVSGYMATVGGKYYPDSADANVTFGSSTTYNYDVDLTDTGTFESALTNSTDKVPLSSAVISFYSSTTDGEGADAVGVDFNATNYTNTDGSVGGHLSGIDTEIGAVKTKTDHITVTQAVDLDDVESKANAAAVSATLASTANGAGASLIGVEDAASNFTATDLEAVLAELHTTAATGIGAGSITETELNASVNASLDLADSALQAADIADVAKTYVATVNYNDSSPVTLVSNLPSGSEILEVKALVKVAFDGTTPTIKIGSSGDDDSVIGTTEVDLTDASAGGNPTVLAKWVEWGSTEDLICTIGGSGATAGQVKLAITVA